AVNQATGGVDHRDGRCAGDDVLQAARRDRGAFDHDFSELQWTFRVTESRPPRSLKSTHFAAGAPWDRPVFGRRDGLFWPLAPPGTPEYSPDQRRTCGLNDDRRKVTSARRTALGRRTKKVLPLIPPTGGGRRRRAGALSLFKARSTSAPPLAFFR